MEHGGTYEIIARNRFGEARNSVDLEVLNAPMILKPLENQTSNGHSVTFRAKISGNPKVTWFHNGNKIKENDNIKFEQTKEEFLLKIDKCTKENDGDYQLS